MESEHLKVSVRVRPLLHIDNTFDKVIYIDVRTM
jgi:hypothetical protein